MNKLIDKPIVEVLQEAGLINSAQLQVALMEKDIYPDLELEEILLLHGWLKQKTMDFFVGMYEKPYFDKILVIGQLLCKSGLLSKEDVEFIVGEQKIMGLDFGSVAVLKGFIKQETLDFFIQNFITQKTNQTISQSKKTLVQIPETPEETINSPNYASAQKNTRTNHRQNDNYSFVTLLQDIKIKSQENNTSIYEELVESDLDDIPWID